MKSLVVSALAILAAASVVSPAFALPKLHNVVLVPGAFADAGSWKKVSEILRAKGYKVTTVEAPLTSLADDVAATKAVLDAVDGHVILVGHSWGGRRDRRGRQRCEGEIPCVCIRIRTG